MKRIALLLISLFCNFLLHADTEFDHLPENVKKTLEDCSKLTNLEGEPSTMIGGCVNAVTGSFVERELDLVIPGVSPFEIVRKKSYSGTLDDPEYLSNLSINCFDWVHATCERWEPDVVITNYEESGGRAIYAMAKSGKKKKLRVPYLQSQLYQGVTNTMQGSICGRTAKHNSHAFIDGQGDELTIYTPHGSEKQYLRDVGRGRSYRLENERFLSGLTVGYAYKVRRNEFKDNRYVLTNKVLYNRAGQATAQFAVDTLNYEELKIYKKLYIWGSNHTHVGYEFAEHTGGKDREFRLTHVIKPNGVENWYEWGQQSHNPLTKRWPEGRYLTLKSYLYGTTEVLGEKVYIGDDEDRRLQRVRALGGPVGWDHQEHITHQFIYHMKKKEKELCSTEVHDCYGNKTLYYYDIYQKLHSIVPLKKYSHYVKDRLYWDGSRLKIRSIESGDNVLTCCHYEYDGAGNPLQISYYGDLTGRGTVPIRINKDGTKIESETEKHVITSVYSVGGKNLKIEENDGLKITKYKFIPDSDLLDAKYICSLDGVIRERFFFEYDSNTAVTLEIIDDGNALDRHDLSGVTMRTIKRTITSQQVPFGYPVDIKTFYLDMATGQEVMVQRETRQYDHRGNLLYTSMNDANDAFIGTVAQTYDNRNNLLTVTDHIGRQTTRVYDANNNLVFERKPGTLVSTRQYDYSNRVVSEDVHLGNGVVLSQKYQYDLLSRKIAETNAQGETTRYEYDFLGRMVKSIQPTGETSTIDYNLLSQPVSIVDGEGRNLKIEYNCRHKPTRMYYPNGSVETWYYTLTGLLEEHIGITGIRTCYEYDYKSRCTKKTIHSPGDEEPLQHTWNYGAFNLISEMDAAGIETKYSYDGAGRLICKESNGISVFTEYNARGLVSKVIETTDDGFTTVIAREYDDANRVSEEREEDSEGTVFKRTRYSYDEQDRILEITTDGNEVHRSQKSVYGLLDEVALHTDSEGNETRNIVDYLFYDESGKWVKKEQRIDPQGNILEMRIDSKGKHIRSKFISALGTLLKEEFYHYDSSGNPIKLEEFITTQGKDARRVVTTWEYDWFNRLTARTDAVGTPEQKRTEISYNNYGQKQFVIKPDGTHINFSYDGFGRLSLVQSNDLSIQYQVRYDERSRLAAVEEAQGTTTRYYNDRNQLIKEVLSNQQPIAYQVDTRGRPTRLEYPDGTSVVYEYDSRSLVKIKRYDAQQNLKYEHQYLNFNGDNKALKMVLAGNAGTVEAKYDIQGRTVEIGHSKWNETVPENGYDSLGNLKAVVVRDEIGEKEYQYGYDPQKQLVKEDEHEYVWDSQYNCVVKDGVAQETNDLNQLISDGTQTFQYDLNGNLISKGGISFTYDALDRLTSVESTELKFEYQYDFQNRRVAKKRYRKADRDWNIEAIEKYLYAGDQEIGACNGDDQLFQLRILGVGLGAEIGASVAIEVEGKTYAPIHNHIGHITALIDTESGETAQTYRYTAFGTQQTEDKVANPWKFASKRHDDETGFYNFGRRYYCPTMMRWLTPDPIDRKGGPNIYAYVLNAPLTSFDLYGFYPMGQLVNKSDFKQTTKMDQLRAALNMIPCGPTVLDIIFGAANAMKSTVYSIVTGIVQAGYGIGKIIGNLPRATEKFATSSEGFRHVNGYSHPNIMLCFHSGVMNTHESAYETGEKISAQGGNIELDLCNERTSGIIWDLAEVALLKMGFKTPAVYRAHEQIKEMLEKNPEKILTLLAHSKGTEIMYQAMKMLTQDERDRINFAGFGGARMVEKGFCRDVKNYVSQRDSIPFIADPLAHLNSSKYEVEYLGSNGTYFMDHSIGGDTYTSARQDYITSLLEESR